MTFHRDPPGRLPTARQTLYSPDTSTGTANNTMVIQPKVRGSHTTVESRHARATKTRRWSPNAVATSYYSHRIILEQHKQQLRRVLLARLPTARILERWSAATVVEVCTQAHTRSSQSGGAGEVSEHGWVLRRG